jgi:hypothetical protein
MARGADPLSKPQRTARHRPPLPGLARPQSETAPTGTASAGRASRLRGWHPGHDGESAGTSHAIPVGITLDLSGH